MKNLISTKWSWLGLIILALALSIGLTSSGFPTENDLGTNVMNEYVLLSQNDIVIIPFIAMDVVNQVNTILTGMEGEFSPGDKPFTVSSTTNDFFTTIMNCLRWNETLQGSMTYLLNTDVLGQLDRQNPFYLIMTVETPLGNLYYRYVLTTQLYNSDNTIINNNNFVNNIFMPSTGGELIKLYANVTERLV